MGGAVDCDPIVGFAVLAGALLLDCVVENTRVVTGD
jgi:hypothetical protein